MSGEPDGDAERLAWLKRRHDWHVQQRQRARARATSTPAQGVADTGGTFRVLPSLNDPPAPRAVAPPSQRQPAPAARRSMPGVLSPWPVPVNWGQR